MKNFDREKIIKVINEETKTLCIACSEILADKIADRSSEWLSDTFDPYTNRIPWGLLTEEERSVIENGRKGAEVEFYVNSKWKPTLPHFYDEFIYRLIKPEVKEEGKKEWVRLKPTKRGQLDVSDAINTLILAIEELREILKERKG
jgi:hypothetical protein